VGTNRRPIVRMLALLLAACLLLQAGCSAVPVPTLVLATLTSTSIPTPTEGPIIQCTPPLCWEDEVFSCPGKCPGGCGTICSTSTPDPHASPTPTFPPLSDVCALPTPDPAQTGPRMSLCPSAYEVPLGGVIQVALMLTGLEHLDFVSITGQNADNLGNFYARARTGDHFPALYNSGAHLSLEVIQTHNDQMFLLLQAVSPGVVKIDFHVIPASPDVQSSITLTVQP
jgi:hypothetical protein